MSNALDDVIAEILVRFASHDGHLVVGVDGPDGAGKTVLAGKLRDEIAGHLGDNVVLVSLDYFHFPRAVRYQLGSDSPVGFFEHSYDYGELVRRVLKPIKDSAGDGVSIIPGSHDVETDQFIEPPVLTLNERSIVILEGIFLHRDELVDYLDYSIFLDVPFSETSRRMSIRDGSAADPQDPSMHRYIEGQRIYFRTANPAQRADVVLDNSYPDGPRLVVDFAQSHASKISSSAAD